MARSPRRRLLQPTTAASPCRGCGRKCLLFSWPESGRTTRRRSSPRCSWRAAASSSIRWQAAAIGHLHHALAGAPAGGRRGRAMGGGLRPEARAHSDDEITACSTRRGWRSRTFGGGPRCAGSPWPAEAELTTSASRRPINRDGQSSARSASSPSMTKAEISSPLSREADRTQAGSVDPRRGRGCSAGARFTAREPALPMAAPRELDFPALGHPAPPVRKRACR